MNTSFFYIYLAEQLHTHIRLFNQNHQLLESFILRNDLPDSFTESEELLELLCQVNQTPVLCSVNDLLSYISIPVEDATCIIGPVGVCANAVLSHHLPQLTVSNELIANLYPAGSNLLIRTGVLLFNLFSETPIDLIDCYNKNCTNGADLVPMAHVTRRIFLHEEYGENHNSYEQEQREMKGIETGNIEQLKKSWSEDSSGRLGRLSIDSIRHGKYLGIVNIALSTRAAIRGGLPSELAFSLSDAYCQQVDALRDDQIMDLEALIHNIQLTYANLVAQRKSKSSSNTSEPPLITKTKNFIFSKLHGKLTVNDVAEAMHTHPNYLNRTFKQVTGVTIHDYIMQEKINLATNMLIYSEYSYIEIANYLGFTTQSHLGDIFKKYTGMTLKQYRSTYKKTSFS